MASVREGAPSDGTVRRFAFRFTGMAGFAPPHEPQDNWKLVLFIRHVPQLTAEEGLEMERYDPNRYADPRKIIISEGWRSVEETPTSCLAEPWLKNTVRTESDILSGAEQRVASTLK